MALTPDALLTGPRGRRLCLEFALASERRSDPANSDLATSVHLASGRLEPEGDQRGWLMTAHAVSGTGADPTSSHMAPGDVAALLDETDLAEATEDLLRFVLGDVVAFARYWQEPDGSELLAAAPELRTPLRRLAIHVLRSEAARWWSDDVDLHEQFCVRWPEVPRVDLSADPLETLRSWAEEQAIGERRALRERPADPAARFSGLWWSKPPSQLLHTSPCFSDGSPTELYFTEDSFGWMTGQSLRVELFRDPLVYEIHTDTDWIELCRRFPMEVTGEKRHDWYRTTGRAGRWVMPDWEAVAGHYDAVHLSVAGYLTAAGRAIDVGSDAGTASVIAGWNPGETWWLTAGPGLGTELTHWQLTESLHWRKVESCAQDEYPPAG